MVLPVQESLQDFDIPGEQDLGKTMERRVSAKITDINKGTARVGILFRS